MTRRVLVVVADDYGLTDGVSRGILRAHHEGIVTSTSILANGPAFDRTAAWLDDAPELAVGLHLACVGEDPPLLGAAEIPTLVDRRGRFALSWHRLLPRLLAGRVDQDDLRREFSAQHDRVVAAGLEVAHVNTHQHLHLWPSVGRVVIGLAVAWGVPAIRVTGSTGGSPAGRGVERLSHQLRLDAADAGLVFANRFAGFTHRGRLDASAIDETLTRVARGQGSVELGTHPGEAGDDALARYRWKYRWDDELDALTASSTRAGVRSREFTLGTHRDLEPGRPPAARS